MWFFEIMEKNAFVNRAMGWFDTWARTKIIILHTVRRDFFGPNGYKILEIKLKLQ